jgi:DNA-binding NtrC family response regulator
MSIPTRNSREPGVAASPSGIVSTGELHSGQPGPLPRTGWGVAAGDERTRGHFDFGQFVGRSPVMMRVYARIRRVAAVDSTVLIQGESGTGKELAARALHQLGPRRNGPFVALNCAAVPATLADSELFGHVRGAFTGAVDRRVGRFEQANGGTLLLDEVGEFGLGVQAKLLRVLETFAVTPVGGAEERRTDVRVVAATHRDLHEMVREGSFRADLFYRLDVVTISLPPLRERPEDIPLLVEHFLQREAAERRTAVRRVSPELMTRLIDHGWPGNVRELRNALEGMAVMAGGESLAVGDLVERLAATGHVAVPDGGGFDRVGRRPPERRLAADVRRGVVCDTSVIGVTARPGRDVRSPAC